MGWSAKQRQKFRATLADLATKPAHEFLDQVNNETLSKRARARLRALCEWLEGEELAPLEDGGDPEWEYNSHAFKLEDWRLHLLLEVAYHEHKPDPSDGPTGTPPEPITTLERVDRVRQLQRRWKRFDLWRDDDRRLSNDEAIYLVWEVLMNGRHKQAGVAPSTKGVTS